MKLQDFPILADENIFQLLIEWLRERGFDVHSVRGLALQGTSDEDLMKLAASEGRVILTHDSDFGKIIFTTPTDFVGIIYLRPGHFLSSKHIITIQALLQNNPDIIPPFTITAEIKSDDTVKIRVRNSI